MILRLRVVLVFFFKAEDGIRDADVTRVQTCALPICEGPAKIAHDGSEEIAGRHFWQEVLRGWAQARDAPEPGELFTSEWPGAAGAARGRRGRRPRSEERRVGKECRARWWRDAGKEKR